MAGILTKGITLSYKKEQTFIEIANLQKCPALGGSAEKVDVTTLADGNYKYIAGIKDFGDLEFEFLYDNSAETSNYRVLKGLEGQQTEWKVTFPDATEFTFSGDVSVSTGEAEVNGALKFTATITLNSDIAVKNPAL